MFTDTHAHYDDEAFEGERDNILSSLREKGVEFIVNAAQDYETSLKCIKLAERYDNVYAAVGIHPHNAGSFSEEIIERLAKLVAEHPRVVAIGETGLDYHYDFSPRDRQRENFIANIRLAKSLDLPVIIHDREAHEDVINIMIGEDIPPHKAVFHCYSGSVETARVISKKGWYFSIGGSVTFKNARHVKEAAAFIPDSLLMLETDCPYMGSRTAARNAQ